MISRYKKWVVVAWAILLLATTPVFIFLNHTESFAAPIGSLSANYWLLILSIIVLVAPLLIRWAKSPAKLEASPSVVVFVITWAFLGVAYPFMTLGKILRDTYLTGYDVINLVFGILELSFAVIIFRRLRLPNQRREEK
jgi:hypothetical protein